MYTLLINIELAQQMADTSKEMGDASRIPINKDKSVFVSVININVDVALGRKG